MTGVANADMAVAAWRTHRAYLVNVAFRMVGDVGAAEDIVQEAFVRFAAAADDVADARGWLTTVTGRLCLDYIRSAWARRERADDTAAHTSTAPVAGQPPIDPADRVTLDDEVRTALSVVLERLSAAERVAFVLHDVFQTPFGAIADTLGRPIGTCRQLARRARQKVASTPLRPNEITRSEHDLVTERFIIACAGGDLDALVAVLDPRVWGIAEFGEDSPLDTQVRRGAVPVARNLIRFLGRQVTLVSCPGVPDPTLLAYVDRHLYATIILTVDNGLVTKVHASVTQ